MFEKYSNTRKKELDKYVQKPIRSRQTANKSALFCVPSNSKNTGTIISGFRYNGAFCV